MGKKLSFTGEGGGGGGGGAFDSAGNMYGRSEWSVISVYGLSFQFTVCHFSLWSVIMEGALEKLY